MEAVIIKKKDLERLGKEVLKEVYYFLDNEYIVNEYENIKEEQKKLNRRLILHEVKTNNEFKNYFDLDEDRVIEKYKKISKSIEDRVKNGIYFIDTIYHFLIDINLEKELDDDVLFKLEAFLEIYRVVSYHHSYLED